MKRNRCSSSDSCCYGPFSVSVSRSISGSSSDESSLEMGFASGFESECEVCFHGHGGKRVAVVVDESASARDALLWALSHVFNPFLDILSLLFLHACHHHHHSPLRQVGLCFGLCDEHGKSSDRKDSTLANALKALCMAHCPEARIEAVGIHGDEGPAIVSQMKKLDVSVLVIGQQKTSLLQRVLRSSKKADMAEFCIENAPCLTFGVRKQSNSLGGYIINTRFHRNFWLLA